MSYKITVKQLRSTLASYPQDATVLISRDEEGNQYHHLGSIDPNVVYKDRGYDVEVGIIELDDDLREMGLTEADLMNDGTPAIILYPR